MTSFTYRGARSGSLLGGLALAISVETVALHLWLASRHPAFAWAMTIGSIATLVWHVRQFGFCLDAPDAFIAALSEVPGATSPPDRPAAR
jgi:hypothetical protein